MIDPLDGPWTVRRGHKPGRRRMAKKSLFTGSREAPPGNDQVRTPDLEMIARADARYGVAGTGISATTSTISPAATTSPSTATSSSTADSYRQPPGRMRSGAGRPAAALESLLDVKDRLARRRRPVTARSQPAARRPARQRRYSAKVAVPVLLGLVVVAAGLVLVIVKLAGLGFNSATGAGAQASPLANPAPPYAGGLPRHYQPETNPTTIALIHDFAQRFASSVAGKYSGQPSGIYREPGAIDPSTDQPGWVMYLGYNSSSNLGATQATVGKLMASLIKTTAPRASWAASPGQLGGTARCAITNLDRTTVTICAWATERTYGAVMSPTSDTRGQELATLLPQMRLDLQS